jgi:hypothetical protein
MKVVINVKFGGFGLSHKGVMRYAELKGIKLYPFIDDISRKVYGDEATVDNPSMLIHYSTQSVRNEKELNAHYFSDRDISRNDPCLVQVVEELGKEANNRFSLLKVVEIPDNVEYTIEEYDGNEHIAEKHRIWE